MVYQAKYRKLNKDVKLAVQRLKRETMEKIVNYLEEDFAANNTKNLFKTVRELEDRPRKPITMVKDKHGNKHSQLNEVMDCWEEHL